MRSVLIATLFLLAGGVPANAQFLEDFEEKLWGVQFTFTPAWRTAGLTEDLGSALFDVDRFDLSGSDYTIGFARGRMRSGHWGLSLLRQRWQDAAICTGFACYEATGSAWLQGFAANWFVPFGSPFAGDRVQAGMHVDVGGGWFHGTMRVDDVTVAGVLPVDVGLEVPAADVLGEPWNAVPVPLFRAEVAVGVTVAPGLKVIGSGGYGFPFQRRFGITLAYFPMAAFN